MAQISHARRAMLKILQAMLQQCVNWELPDVQGEFRKGRWTRNQIANIHWIIETAREFQKIIYFCFIDYAKAFDCVSSFQFSPSIVSDSLQPHELQHARLPCPSPTLRAYSNSCPLSWWSNPLSSPSPPDFSISQHQGLFQWVSSSHQVAEVLEFQLQHQSLQWIFRTDPLGWTGWISLESKGLSRVFSNTTVQKHLLFGAQLSL